MGRFQKLLFLIFLIISPKSAETINNKEIKIVLIGETGIGKSQLGNFILNKKGEFEVGNDFNSKTKDITEKTSYIDDKRMNIEMMVTIVDTPGLSDTNCDDSKIMDKIISKFENDDKIDGIVLVYSYKKPRKVQKDKELINNIKKMFGEDILKVRLKVVFTNYSTGEEFEEEKKEGKIKTQINDIKILLNGIIDEEDLFFVNTYFLDSHKELFYPDIGKLLNKIYEVKEKNGSMKNEKIEKEKLEFIEKEKEKMII